MYRTVIVVVSALMVHCSAVASVPPVSDLIGKYSQALDATDSFVETHEMVSEFSYNLPSQLSPLLNGKRFERGQNRSDGRRKYYQTYEWGDINSQLRNLPETTPIYHLRLEGDGKLYAHNRRINDPHSHGNVQRIPLPEAQKDKAVFSRYSYSGILGFFGSDERLDTVLRRADRISVRQTTEKIRGSACYVIDAHTEYGEYTLWVDREHGCHLAKAIWKAAGGEKSYDRVLKKGETRTASLEAVRFEQVNGVWVPMEAVQTYDRVLANPQFFSRGRAHFKRLQITLDPDHDKQGSFADPLENPTQDPELRNGTWVQLSAGVPPQHIWLDGRVVADVNRRN